MRWPQSLSSVAFGTGWGRWLTRYVALTYGGAFIVLSLLWGWMVGGIRPDRPSTVGAAIALLGAAVIVYWPRSSR